MMGRRKLLSSHKGRNLKVNIYLKRENNVLCIPCQRKPLWSANKFIRFLRYLVRGKLSDWLLFRSSLLNDSSAIQCTDLIWFSCEILSRYDFVHSWFRVFSAYRTPPPWQLVLCNVFLVITSFVLRFYLRAVGTLPIYTYSLGSAFLRRTPRFSRTFPGLSLLDFSIVTY